MGRSPVYGRVIRVLVIAASLLVLANGCTATRRLWWKTKTTTRSYVTRVGRFERIWSRAAAAADDGEYDRASIRYERARRLQPDRAEVALAHAVVLARLGREAECWEALEAAADHGFRHAGEVENEPAFESLRADARFAELVGRLRENDEVYRAKLEQARRPPPVGSAPEFPSHAALIEAFDREKRKLERSRRRLGYDETEPDRLRLLRREIAALDRYAETHPAAPDHEDAFIAAVRARVLFADPFLPAWRMDISDEIVREADQFRSAFPGSAHEHEVRLYRTVARMRGTLGPDFDWTEDTPPRPRCDDLLPELEELSAGAAEDRWAAAALGFLALCLHELSPADPGRTRETYTTYLDLPEASWDEATPFDFRLRSEMKILKFKVEGPPEFAATTLDGEEVNLAKLRGSFLLLDFWSPG